MAAQGLRQFLHQHGQSRFGGRVVRQVARRASVERGEQQERPGLMRSDKLTSQFAREMKARVHIYRTHLLPGLSGDRESVIGLAPRRRRAVNEMCHLPEGGLRMSQ